MFFATVHLLMMREKQSKLGDFFLGEFLFIHFLNQNFSYTHVGCLVFFVGLFQSVFSIRFHSWLFFIELVG